MSDTTEPSADPNGEPTGSQPQGEPADEPLGEPGVKALHAEREQRKALEKQLTEANARLTDIERANESAIEKAQREAKEAQEAAAKATADALRFKVAAKHGISDDDADLFLTGADAETLERQAARLVERTPSTTPRPDPSQGSKGAPSSTPAQQFGEIIAAQLG